MIKKFKLKYLLVFLWVAVIIIRYELLHNILLFIISVISGRINLTRIDIRMLDYVFAFVIFFTLPILFWKQSRLKNLINKKISWHFTFLSLFLMIVLMAPLLVFTNPTMQHSIKKCKLLPPLSTVIVKSSGSEQQNANTDEYKYFERKIVNRGTGGNSEYIFTRKPEAGGRKIIFIFGTDEYARDVFSRILFGTRFAFLLGLSAVTISFFIAFILGMVAGFGGRIWDNILNRFTEIFLSFPFLFLIIVFLAFFGNSFWVVVIVLGFSGWMGLFKIIRAEILRLKSKDFILSAKMLGIPDYKILLKEILPVIFAPLTVSLVLQFGNVIMAESALSFLGFGVGEEYFSWGSMINSGQYYLSTAWWLSFFPGLFLAISLLVMNKLGNVLEKIYNPESTK